MTEKEGPEELVDAMVDRSGALWIASGGLEGISRFANGKLEMLDTRDGLASNDVRETLTLNATSGTLNHTITVPATLQ